MHTADSTTAGGENENEVYAGCGISAFSPAATHGRMCGELFQPKRLWRRCCDKCWPDTRHYAQRAAYAAINGPEHISVALTGALRRHERKLRKIAANAIDSKRPKRDLSSCIGLLENADAWRPK